MSSRWIPLLLLAGSCSLLGSCATLGGSEKHHVGGHATLDQAAAAANPDSAEKSRRLDVGHRTRHRHRTETEVEIEESESESEPGPDVPRGRLVLGLVGGAGAIGGHRYDGFGDLGIDLGQMRDRLRWDVLFTVSPTQFASQTIAGQSFVDEREFNVEVNGRVALTSPQTAPGAYGIAGFRISNLLWNYARPVPILENGVPRNVTSDQIEHWAIFAGAGVTILQNRHVQAGFQGLGGVRFYSWETEDGFSNTLFPAAGFVLGRFELGWKFGAPRAGPEGY